MTVILPWDGDGDVYIWFVTDYGRYIPIEPTFDPQMGTISFDTDRLGLFVIGAADRAAVFVNPFGDVVSTDWFYDYIAFVYLRGLMIGIAPGEFAPNMPTGRAMVVQVLFNMAGRPDISGLTNPFSDISADSWYHDAVIWAAANDLITGFDGIFAPTDNITRAHLVLILNRYAQSLGIILPTLQPPGTFTDATDIRNYAREAIDRFFEAMIITGYPDGSFNPDGEATRAEMAAVVQRFIEAEE
jgi:hypothetical protein